MGARHARTRRLGEQPTPVTTTFERFERWRRHGRSRALRRLVERTRDLPWSAALLDVLLDELHVDDVFEEIVGDITRLRVGQYPHAVVMALAIRHSWRPDDLSRFTRRLHLPRPGATLERSSPSPASTKKRRARTPRAGAAPSARP